MEIPKDPTCLIYRGFKCRNHQESLEVVMATLVVKEKLHQLEKVLRMNPISTRMKPEMKL